MNKKVLIITYYWPPAGGPGVQRWLKFVKYLPEFNIEPVVYCPSNPSYPIIDSSLASEVLDEVTVLKQSIKEPYKYAGFLSKESKIISKGIIPENKKQGFIQKLMLYVRGNFFIPDARKGWIKPSVRYLSTYISDYKIDTIITTGPPHSLHLIGLQLKDLHGVEWVADFRDPWTSIGYHKKLKLTKSSQKKHKNLEKKVLTTADKIIVTSNNTKKEFKQLTEQSITVITNGYDVVKPADITRDSKFTLSHIGSFLSERNPEILWKVLQDLRNEDDGFKSDFELKLIGAVSDSVLKSICNYGLNDCLDNVGYVSHSKALVFQKQTQLLLLVEIDSEETKAIIPGKIFEYMVSERPIVAIGPTGSDVESILKETNTGSYFNYDDYDALKTTFKTHYNVFKMGDLKTQAIGLQKYSRRNLTKSLADLL